MKIKLTVGPDTEQMEFGVQLKVRAYCDGREIRPELEDDYKIYNADKRCFLHDLKDALETLLVDQGCYTPSTDHRYATSIEFEITAWETAVDE